MARYLDMGRDGQLPGQDLEDDSRRRLPFKKKYYENLFDTLEHWPKSWAIPETRQISYEEHMGRALGNLSDVQGQYRAWSHQARGSSWHDLSLCKPQRVSTSIKQKRRVLGELSSGWRDPSQTCYVINAPYSPTLCSTITMEEHHRILVWRLQSDLRFLYCSEKGNGKGKEDVI